MYSFFGFILKNVKIKRKRVKDRKIIKRKKQILNTGNKTKEIINF
jgi:hypothetical protein